MPDTWIDGADVYNFVEWEDASTVPSRTISLTADTTITATYTTTPPPLTIDTVIALVEEFYDQGEIDESEIVTSLTDKLYAAKPKIDAGKQKTAKNILKAFINHLEAQSGKHVSEAAASVLIAEAEKLINGL